MDFLFHWRYSQLGEFSSSEYTMEKEELHSHSLNAPSVLRIIWTRPSMLCSEAVAKIESPFSSADWAVEGPMQ